MGVTSVSVFLQALMVACTADMMDVVMPHYLPPKQCVNGCADWNTLDAATVQAIWQGKPPQDVGGSCAIPARAVDEAPCYPGLGKLVCNSSTSSFYGPICACKGESPLVFATCTAPESIPEQVNLQVAEWSVVVVSFVTFDVEEPSEPPEAAFQEVFLNGSVGPMRNVSGVSHRYTSNHVTHSQFCSESLPGWIPCLHRNYTMSFVRMTGFRERTTYRYYVKGGSEHAVWSKAYTFRSLYGSNMTTTRVGIYGDMGNTLHNNMGNLKVDCENGMIDAVVHLGDHCYDLSMGNDLHGDAYMNAFEPVLSSCPWLPVIGNHESTSGNGHDRVDASAEEHYLNQTWGVVIDSTNISSTANSSIGHLLTKGTYYSSGSHGRVPSRTSQWFSVDIGQIHFAMLDLDPGPPPIFAGAQVEWLTADLQKATENRHNVPWIVVGSHFPLYAGRFGEKDGVVNEASLKWYVGEESEGERGAKEWVDLPSFERCTPKDAAQGNCTTVASALNATSSTLEPIMDKYNVDIYISGHVHSYSVTWPLCSGQVCDGKRSYDNPAGVVHVLEGNGGVPNAASNSSAWNNTLGACSSGSPQTSIYRVCGTGGAYGRLTAQGQTLRYDHVENPTGKVSDTWTISRSNR